MIKIFLLLIATNLCAQNLTWDANTENDLAGYRVYSGSASGDYSLLQDVGLVNKFALSFKDGIGRFFSVTAYDRSGNESGYSQEIYWQAPTTTPPSEIEWLLSDPVIFIIQYDKLDTQGNPLEPEIELQAGLGTFSPLQAYVNGDTLRTSLENHAVGEHLTFRARLLNPGDKGKTSDWAYIKETLILIKPADGSGFPRPVKVFRLVL